MSWVMVPQRRISGGVPQRFFTGMRGLGDAPSDEDLRKLALSLAQYAAKAFFYGGGAVPEGAVPEEYYKSESISGYIRGQFPNTGNEVGRRLMVSAVNKANNIDDPSLREQTYSEITSAGGGPWTYTDLFKKSIKERAEEMVGGKDLPWWMIIAGIFVVAYAVNALKR